MDSSRSTTSQPSADPHTHLVEDLDRTGPLSVTTRKDITALLLARRPASALAHAGPEAELGGRIEPLVLRGLAQAWSIKGSSLSIFSWWVL